MNHALRVDDDFQLCGRAIKQPVRFDKFQTFVHHGGGIDRDFLAHAPIWVLHGLFGRDVRELLNIGVQERTARCGQDNGLDAVFCEIAGIGLGQHLENSIVFAVDG